MISGKAQWLKCRKENYTVYRQEELVQRREVTPFSCRESSRGKDLPCEMMLLKILMMKA